MDWLIMMRGTLIAAVILTAAASFAIASEFRGRHFAPEQPIAFNHRDHVVTDHLECELCHSGVRRSAFADIAPIERCMGCHQYVLTASPEVTKLRRAWNAGKTIEWVKVSE